MSLETEIKKLTVAIENAVAALSEKGSAPAQASPNKPAQASPAAAAPTPAKVPVVDVFDTPPAAADVLVDVPAPAITGEVIDKKQVINAILSFAKQNGREAAHALMAEFGAKKASELNDAAQYPAILAKIVPLLSTAA